MWQAVAGLLGGFFNSNQNEKNNEAIAAENQKNRDFAHSEAELAHGRQLEIMDKQNQWNSYANQRKLLEEAGYNPNALFNSSSTLSASSGASGGAQAAAPSSGFPKASLLDPQMLNAFADINLKNSQANKNNADTDKSKQETINVQLDNDLKTTENALWKEFGRSKWQLELNKTDVERAVAESQRELNKIKADLDFNELHNMRPLEAANTVADTLNKNMDTDLKRILSIKNETERKIALEQLAISKSLAASTLALNYAGAYYQRVQGSLWDSSSSNGILYRKAVQDKGISEFQLFRMRSTYNAVFDEWKTGFVTALRTNGLYNSELMRLIKRDPDFFNQSWNIKLGPLGFDYSSSSMPSPAPVLAPQ